MESELRGLKQAKRNSLDGISMVQTLEGSIQIVQENFQRIRELMVQATNGTNGQNELDAMQREINELINTAQDITEGTNFREYNIH